MKKYTRASKKKLKSISNLLTQRLERCTICNVEYRKKYYKKNKARINEYRKNYLEKIGSR